MRRLCPLICLVVIAGCRGNSQDRIVGTWRIDPASVKSSRLGPGADGKPDWTDATKVMGRVEVQFTKPDVVQAKGLGQTSEARWKLQGSTIEIDGAREQWPTMTLDPSGQRIHLLQERGEDRLQLDLVKT